jgi:hypothetical protein
MGWVLMMPLQNDGDGAGVLGWPHAVAVAQTSICNAGARKASERLKPLMGDKFPGGPLVGDKFPGGPLMGVKFPGGALMGDKFPGGGANPGRNPTGGAACLDDASRPLVA